MQVANLKAAAEKEMKAVHEAINQQTMGGQTGPMSAEDKTAPLRARLNKAIEAMQEGLVERDTEASSSDLTVLMMHHVLSYHTCCTQSRLTCNALFVVGLKLWFSMM